MKKWEIGFLIGLGSLGTLALCLCFLCITTVAVDTLKMLSDELVHSLSDCIIAIVGAIFSGAVGTWIGVFLWSRMFSRREQSLKTFDFPFSNSTTKLLRG